MHKINTIKLYYLCKNANTTGNDSFIAGRSCWWLFVDSACSDEQRKELRLRSEANPSTRHTTDSKVPQVKMNTQTSDKSKILEMITVCEETKSLSTVISVAQRGSDPEARGNELACREQRHRLLHT